MARKAIVPTARIGTAAADAGLGGWASSFRVNSRRESALLITGIVALIVGVGGAVAAALLGMPWYGVLILEIFLVAVALFGLVLLWTGIRYHRVGPWLVHRFESGFVMERTRGSCLPIRYDVVSARLFRYLEPGDSSSESTDHLVLELRLPGGTLCSMAEPETGAVVELAALAALCGAGEPGELSYPEAIEKLGRESWGGAF